MEKIDKDIQKKLKEMKKNLFKRFGYDKELRLAKMNEAYHRKKMEYFKEEIKLLEGEDTSHKTTYMKNET